ncbi:alpha-N-acetylgalactosaminide alpha-2,6-sialyltransferase 1-like, partial [Clarias magur]
VNGAVTKGFEEDVGNKTSVYVHTSFALIQSLRILEKYGFKRIPDDDVDVFGFITADHGKYPNYYYDRTTKTQ